MGNRLDTDDNRTGPLSQITAILADVNFKYIFVENVQGFEDSTARDNLLEVLTKLKFKWQEFMLTPRTLGVPNSRLRYYLIGKHQDLSSWPFTLQQGSFLSEIPNWNPHPDNQNMPFVNLKNKIEAEVITRRKLWKEKSPSTFLQKNSEEMNQLPFCVGDIIEWDIPDDLLSRLKVSNSTLKKYYQAMDIVTPFSINTCCFTKGYGKFVKGTGSILKLSCDDDDDNQEDCINSSSPTKTCEEQQQNEILSLRYFSPKEISRLMSYPEEFQLPPKLSLQQKYRSLGNSVNVYVVAVLFTLLFSN